MIRSISITHLRMLILAANVLLAFGLVYKALGEYGILDAVFGSAESEDERPTVLDLKRFTYDPDADRSTRPINLGPKMTQVSQRLSPRKPTPIGLLDSKDPAHVTELDSEDVETFDGGPLERDGWIYAYYIAWENDPLKSLVAIRKKTEDKKANRSRSAIQRQKRGSGRATRRATARTRKGKSSRSRNRNRLSQSPQITFTVGDRWIQSEEHDLDFKVERADAEALVYWIDDPKTMYALRHEPQSPYFKRRKLEPEKDSDAEDKDEDDEEKKEMFIVVPEGDKFESEREKDYRRLATGQPTKNIIRPVQKSAAAPTKRRVTTTRPAKRVTTTRPTTRSTASPRSSAGEKRTRPPNVTRKPSVSPPATLDTNTRGTQGAQGTAPEAGTSTAPTREGVQQLREATENLRPEDRQRIEDALSGRGS